MQDRIKKFLQAKGITAAEMADSIGVQRSNVSHIINGRNKPGYSFIEKLIQTYPEINTQWLLSGSGEMFISRKKTNEADLFNQEVKTEPTQAKETINELITTKIPVADISIKQIRMAEPKTVERIVVFFSDKTFKEYNPE